MHRKHAAGAPRLALAVLGGCLTLSVAPAFAQEVALQSSRAGHDYVLVGEGGRWILADSGREPLAIPSDATLMLEAVAALDSGWLVAGHQRPERGTGRELVLLRGGGGGAPVKLPVPPTANSSLRSPQPLVEAGELVGLVWLEGTGSSLGVRAATWNGAGFTAAEWVAPALDEGSQLALSAIVLADGSWLLVWSAYDGHDDEIVWSRREGGVWSAPAPLHADNEVPDVTPVVAATARGAAVAWSRYDGGTYRVRVARWRDGSWRDEERLGGAGSVFPFFVAADAAGAHLAFPEGLEGEWTLVELGASGQVTSRTRWQGDSRARPLVRRGAGGRARLQWLGSDAARDTGRRP